MQVPRFSAADKIGVDYNYFELAVNTYKAERSFH